MSYLARKLITNAYYLSGVVSRTLQTVGADKMSDGLELLNAVLAIKQAQTRLVPYYKEHTFNAVAQQETYFIENLIETESLTFNIGTVRFPSSPKTRREYNASGRVDNIYSLPGTWHAERMKGGTQIRLYFIPDTNYPIKIWGKFGLDDVSLDEDLELTYDRFYIEYLRYALAEYICADFGISFQPQSYKKLNEYEAILTDISPLDLTSTKRSTLTKGIGYSWPWVNLGGGFWPP